MNKQNPSTNRMGTDPLSWIKDSRQTGSPSNISKPSKHIKLELPGKQDNPSNQRKPKSTRAGLRTGWTRATFIIRERHGDSIKALAYWDRRDIKDILDEALTEFLKNKPIKPIPRGQT